VSHLGPLNASRSTPAARLDGGGRAVTHRFVPSNRTAVWVPLLYAAGALGAGLAFPRLERSLFPGLSIGVDPGAALAVLTSIGSGMMGLTAIVFSIAFVMVQFSATAYSPRLVLWLAKSAAINHSIGLFTATFVYALGAAAWINRDGSGVVPPFTVWFAVALLIASLALFVLLIERVGMLQVTRVLRFAGDEGRAVIEKMYGAPADNATRTGQSGSTATADVHMGLPEIRVLAHEGAPVVVQAVDTGRMAALAAETDSLVLLAVAVGDTVMEGMPLMTVRGHGRAPAEAALRRAISLGGERTFEQDPKYALRILVDVAIKALSPAINDPTTAVQALDQIEDLLLRLGRCNLDVGRIHDAAGRLRVVMPVPSWEDLVALALDEVRYCGATSVQVMRRLRALLQDVANHVHPDRRAALQYFLVRVDNGIRRDFADADDQRDALAQDRQGLGLARDAGSQRGTAA
jgi:uncharacterized membrane protein